HQKHTHTHQTYYTHTHTHTTYYTHTHQKHTHTHTHTHTHHTHTQITNHTHMTYYTHTHRKHYHSLNMSSAGTKTVPHLFNIQTQTVCTEHTRHQMQMFSRYTLNTNIQSAQSTLNACKPI